MTASAVAPHELVSSGTNNRTWTTCRVIQREIERYSGTVGVLPVRHQQHQLKRNRLKIVVGKRSPVVLLVRQDIVLPLNFISGHPHSTAVQTEIQFLWKCVPLKAIPNFVPGYRNLIPSPTGFNFYVNKLLGNDIKLIRSWITWPT